MVSQQPIDPDPEGKAFANLAKTSYTAPRLVREAVETLVGGTTRPSAVRHADDRRLPNVPARHQDSTVVELAGIPPRPEGQADDGIPSDQSQAVANGGAVTANFIPQAAELIAGVLPIDTARLQENLSKIFEQIESLSAAMQPGEKREIIRWLVGAGTVTLAYEMARRRLNRQGGQPEFNAMMRAQLTLSWITDRSSAITEDGQ
jgi:hypothetical protein